jgi:hypothetical protein
LEDIAAAKFYLGSIWALIQKKMRIFVMEVLDLQDFSKGNETDGQKTIGNKEKTANTPAQKNDKEKDIKKDMKA